MKKGEKPCEFQSGKSSKAVTHKVKIGRMGNMTLIDTPGTNDTSENRQDIYINIELINKLRSMLYSEKQGITSFT